MRELLAKDIAPVSKILSKMELKDAIKSMFSGKTEQGEMLSELIVGIIDNYYKAEKDVFIFLAEVESKTVEEIENLPVLEFIDLIKKIVYENLPFFKYAVK